VLYPLLVGFNTIPKVALVPLLAIWFGIGAIPAIITAFTLAFFPIVVNVAAGLATVEPEMQDVLRSLGASRWEIFQKVGFPHSLPYLFASLKVAISQAFIGSVISETVASDRGIGYVIVSASASFNVALAFLAILSLAAMGIVLYGCFALVETRVWPLSLDDFSCGERIEGLLFQGLSAVVEASPIAPTGWGIAVVGRKTAGY
jgi:NitT/TauT family transport system permease protein